MKAVRYDQYGPAEVLRWTDIPAPRPHTGEVLVKVAAAAINPKDVLVRKGRMKLFTRNRLPRGTGHDFSGTVVETSPGVTKLKPGDEVFGMLNRWDAGSCAQYLTCPEDELAIRPARLALEDCAALPLVCLTSLQALRDLAHLQPGHQLLINGASGGVGVHAIQIAKILGAEVHAITSKRNAELVRSLGADVVVDYASTSIDGLAQRYDVFYDVFGNYSFARARHLLKAQGCYVTTVPSLSNLRDHLLSLFSRRQRARLVVVRSRRADLELLREWVQAGRLQAIIDRRMPMSEAAEAHRYLETKRARGKLILNPA